MAATVFRYWKEAAALIIVRRLSPTQCPTEVVAVSPQGKTTRQPVLNYQIFMAERTALMSNFAKAHVFPGGSAEEVDFSAQWLDVLSMGSRKPGQEQTPEGQLVDLFNDNHNKGCSRDNDSRTPMYCRQRLPSFRAIPSEVAFRITAIRELFEEIGVLLARKAENSKTDEEKEESLMQSHDGRRCQAKICHLPLHLSEFWRKSVVENPENFLHMCKELKLVPDITSLSEWGNWLTPTHVSDKRFDTMFYITFLDEHQQLDVRLDRMEYVGHSWLSPSKFLSEARSLKLHIFPPQIWELYHLIFSSWEELYNLVALNPYMQPKRFFSVKINCKDGALILLPGDYMYPENPSMDVYKEISVPFTRNEIQSAGKFLNHFDAKERKIYRTIPLSPPRPKVNFKSHL